MKPAILVLACLVCATVALQEGEYQGLFSSWMSEHSKTYSQENFFYRYTVFKKNVDFVIKHNAEGHSYEVGMNHFGDLTNEEFKAFNGFIPIKKSYYRQLNFDDAVPTAMESLDWRTKGAVTPMKDQGQCGSCWAFSATASMEGSAQIEGSAHQLPNLSEQELVDCSTAYGNEGCNGGWMDSAFQYVIDKKGLANQKDYPYTARDGKCKSPLPARAVDSAMKGFTDVPEGDETSLMAQVQKGPTSVAIAADSMAFQFYKTGVFDSASCGRGLNHGVAAVGFGTEGKDYWIIKNSWGTGWGEKGYMKMVRNKDMCGVADAASRAWLVQ